MCWLHLGYIYDSINDDSNLFERYSIEFQRNFQNNLGLVFESILLMIPTITILTILVIMQGKDDILIYISIGLAFLFLLISMIPIIKQWIYFKCFTKALFSLNPLFYTDNLILSNRTSTQSLNF